MDLKCSTSRSREGKDSLQSDHSQLRGEGFARGNDVEKEGERKVELVKASNEGCCC